MKTLNQICIEHGVRSREREYIRRLAVEWLAEFRSYLPPKDVSEHARGAHDAINDLESWITLVPEQSNQGDKK